MAKMFPQGEISFINKSEREFYELFKNSSFCDNWTVFYSHRLVEERYLREIDFLVFIPGEGISIIELKANNPVKISQDTFVYNYAGEIKEQENPFRKIKNIASQFRTLLKLSDRELEKVFISHIIIFPYYNKMFDKKICFSEYNYINAFTEKEDMPAQIVNFSRKQKEITKRLDRTASVQELNAIMDKVIVELRHEFSVDEKDIARELSRESREKSSKYLLTTYAMLRGMKRLFVFGGAGTGKTFLAVQRLMDKSREGKKTLFLCYNRLLAARIKHEFTHAPGAEVYYMEDYLFGKTGLDRKKIPASKEELEKFYLEKLPAAFLEKKRGQDYDAVIVDEFQDLLLPAYSRVLDASLKGGLRSGEAWFFYDSDQNIFRRDAAYLEMFLRENALEGLGFRLLINYRNAPNIVSLSSQILGENIYERSALHNSGIIEEQFYSDEKDQRNKIENLLTALDGKYRKEDIVLLSVHSLEKSASYAMMKERRGWGRRLAEYGKNGPGEVSCSNTHRFKGLESRIVIVTDIDGESLLPDLKTALYTAVTRASFKLVLLINEKFRAGFEKLISEQ